MSLVGVCGWGVPALMSRGFHPLVSYLWWGTELGRGCVYSKVQCIMANGHMGTPLCTDTHLWKQYLPTTSLASSNNNEVHISTLVLHFKRVNYSCGHHVGTYSGSKSPSCPRIRIFHYITRSLNFLEHRSLKTKRLLSLNSNHTLT